MLHFRVFFFFLLLILDSGYIQNNILNSNFLRFSDVGFWIEHLKMVMHLHLVFKHNHRFLLITVLILSPIRNQHVEGHRFQFRGRVRDVSSRTVHSL